ncbi:amidohydrolase [Chelativorans alearense]|uniref:amidohydrolase n=1 Tax=Chelativorans alearense TaxID=2681495 RepID=UPI0013D37877|nr:amidohydrolase [Chelativorans alearense]
MPTQADQIWFNAQIDTMDPTCPRATALAVRNGRLIAVGSDEAVTVLAGPGTAMRDMGELFLMPGLVESHTHALWGACRDLFEVFVGYDEEFSVLLGAIKERAAATEPGRSIAGGPWRPDMRDQMGSCPRRLLDAITTVHPVILKDVSHHIVWCNSLALEKAGLTAETSDIPGGIVERDETGTPTGILAEAASAPVQALLNWAPEQLAEGCRYFVRYFNRMGITAFKEPMAYEPELSTYHAADQSGDLTLHGAAHIARTSPASITPMAYEEMERLSDRYASNNLRTRFAKLFLDGVAPGFTASFLDPYLAESGYDAAGHDPDATLLIAPRELDVTVMELDRRGFVVKMHAVGDNAIRKGLDAIETTRRTNGPSGLRHEIAHSAFVSDADLPRFRALDAVAEISPKLWYPNPATAAQVAVLGRGRMARLHRVRDLLRAGAEVICASDWPAAAPDANPWTGLAGLISRRNATRAHEGAINPEQAIPLPEALRLYTVNGARSLGMENETGSLETGKWADFIVLNKNPENLDYVEIGATQVRETWWKGRQVYG